MADQSPLDAFKSVLTGTALALAHEPEVELAFTADARSQVGKNFRVPMPEPKSSVCPPVHPNHPADGGVPLSRGRIPLGHA